MKLLIAALLIFISASTALAVPAFPKVKARVVNEKGQYGEIFKMIDARVWVRYTDGEGKPTWPVEVPYDQIFMIEGQSMWAFEHGDEISFTTSENSPIRYGRVVGITVRSLLLVRIQNSSELVKVEARLAHHASCNADFGGD